MQMMGLLLLLFWENPDVLPASSGENIKKPGARLEIRTLLGYWDFLRDIIYLNHAIKGGGSFHRMRKI